MTGALSTYVQRGRPNRACPPRVLYGFARQVFGLLMAGPLRQPLPQHERLVAIGDVLPVYIRAAGRPYLTTGTVNRITTSWYYGPCIELYGWEPVAWILTVGIASIPLEGPIWTPQANQLRRAS